MAAIESYLGQELPLAPSSATIREADFLEPYIEAISVFADLDRIAGAMRPQPSALRFGGVKPANFLDIGGGASAEVMANGLEIVLSDPSVRSVFVNVFGGITSCDAVANGIVSGIGLLESRGEHVDRPIVVRLDGNNAAEGRQILADAAIGVVEQVPTMDGAARRSAELASIASKGA